MSPDGAPPSRNPSATAAGRGAAVSPLRAARFRFTLEAQANIELTDFAGTVVRGGFGVAFKRTACPLRRQPCETCLLSASCVYLQVFETPAPEGGPLLPRGGKAPRPFVLEPPEEGHRFAPGDTFTVGLTLVGRAEAHLPYFVYAFRRLGEMGIGRGRGRYRLARLELHNPGEPPEPLLEGEGGRLVSGPYLEPLPPIPPVPAGGVGEGRVTVRYHTPMRLKEGGRYGARPTFPILVKHLLRRLSLLAACHEGRPPVLDHRAWIEAAGRVATVAEELTWRDPERYSTRQRSRMRLGGWVGQATYAGPWEPFRPLLAAARLLHVGQGATFGHGRLTFAPHGATSGGGP
ncbi:MAG: CRISPR system precrRNA processing endoribonuclease RAMP protein Cas6 [Nitrospirae bacterium]|nr:MAG: CRISPR system precrRNA processing endoribonuclease RAMP protein Cas6 [Nitrospirota bacterium]